MKKQTPNAELNEKMLAKLSSKKPAEREAAEKALAELGPASVDILRELVVKKAIESKNQRKSTRTFGIIMGALFLVIITAGVIKGIRTGSWSFMSDWSSFFSFFGVFGGAVYFSQGTKNAVQKLSEFDDVRNIGAFLQLWELGDKSLQQTAEDALLRLLPKTTAADAKRLAPPQRQAINAILSYRNSPDLVCVLLKALERIGDEISLPAVQKLAQGDVSQPNHLRIKNAAIECLPYVEVRANESLMAQTLLRASQPDLSTDTLLRPAANVADTNHAALLRPVQEASPLDLTPYATLPTDSAEERQQSVQNS